jgi:hypothetical protein
VVEEVAPMIERIGRALGRAGANFMHFAGLQGGLSPIEQNVILELFRVKLDKLPTAKYCCDGECDDECVATDSPREFKDWWKRD